MKRIRNFIENKKGSFALLWVILIFIGCIVISGFLDIMQKEYIFNEVQGIMDVAGVASLHTGIDQNHLRLETMDADKEMIINNFRNRVESLVPTGHNITYFDISNVTVYPDNGTNTPYNDNWGTGPDKKTHQYVIIDAVAKMRITNSSIFDNSAGLQQRYYNARNNQYFTISIDGTPHDGQTELLIRSVDRIVLY